MTALDDKFMQMLGESGHATESNARAIESLATQLQDKMSQSTEALGQQILNLAANVEAAEGPNASRHAEHEKKLEAAVRDLDSRLRSSVAASQQQTGQFDEKVKSVDGRLRSDLAAQVADWNRAETEIKQSVTVLQRSVENLPQHVDRQVTEASAAQERKATEQNARVLQLCERLDERLSSEVGAAESRVGDAMNRLERKLTDDAERAGTGTQDTISRLASAVDQAATDISKVGADLDGKFTSVCSKLDEKYDGALASVRSQVDAGMRALESSTQKQADDCEQMVRTTDAKFSDDISVLQSRLRDSDRQTVEVREQLTAAASALDRKLSESAAASGEASAALERSVADIARSLVQRIEEAAAAQSSKAAEDRRAGEAAREELLRHIETEQSRADTKLTQLESRVSKSSDDLARQLQEVEDHLADDLAREHGASVDTIHKLSTAVDEQIASQGQVFDSQLKQLEADSRREMSEQESRTKDGLGALERSMAAGLDQLSGDLRDAVSRDELGASLSRLEESTSKVLSSVADKLGRLDDAGRETEDRLGRQEAAGRHTAERIDELSAQLRR